MFIRLNDYNKYKIISKKRNEHKLLIECMCSLVHESALSVANDNNIEHELLSDTDQVINDLRNNNMDIPSPLEFKKSLNKSKHPDMLSDYSEQELAKMKLFKVPGRDIGFALKPLETGYDIVAVHNNDPNIKGIGRDLMSCAIANGGDHLDHFDTPILSNLYANMGFKEYDRDAYDPQYDPDGSFKNKYGELAVIYRKL